MRSFLLSALLLLAGASAVRAQGSYVGDVGTLKTFHVVNSGNVRCNGRYPCSPDGEWQAAVGFSSLEAPRGDYFSNARVSCIAGPCPFTKIRYDGFSRGGPSVRVEVLDWSDTTTFLFERNSSVR